MGRASPVQRASPPHRDENDNPGMKNVTRLYGTELARPPGMIDLTGLK